MNLDNIHIVLHRPRFPENIGAAVRAAKNMGINRLTVVEPEDFDMHRILRMATSAAKDMAQKITVESRLIDAVSNAGYVVGTTARTGRQRQVIHNPADLASDLVPISIENEIAIIFGREDRGLETEDIRLCHALVNIPTSDFSSLNLAQAVMVISYELFKATGKIEADHEPRLANRFELEQMYDNLQKVLVNINFINRDNPEYWMNNFRRFFSRLPLQSKEVQILRGICRQIDWYGNRDKTDL